MVHDEKLAAAETIMGPRVKAMNPISHGAMKSNPGEGSRRFMGWPRRRTASSDRTGRRSPPPR